MELQRESHRNGISLIKVEQPKKTHHMVKVGDLKRLIRAKKQLDNFKTGIMLASVALGFMILGFVMGNGLITLLAR